MPELGRAAQRPSLVLTMSRATETGTLLRSCAQALHLCPGLTTEERGSITACTAYGRRTKTQLVQAGTTPAIPADAAGRAGRPWIADQGLVGG